MSEREFRNDECDEELNEVQEQFCRMADEWGMAGIHHFKWNIGEGESPDDFPYDACIDYVRSLGVCIHATSGGVHYKGLRGIPHVHYVVVSGCFPVTANPSSRKARFAKRIGDADVKRRFSETTQKLTHQYVWEGRLRWQPLAYPLKEGNRLSAEMYHGLSDEYINFLESVGTTIYNTQTALRARQDACEERKKNALTDLWSVVKGRQFRNIREMAQFLDVQYIEKLELTDLPDPRHYDANVKKCATKLGIFKYSELVK